MGAICGFDYRGFIGEVYKLFPFPKRQEDFKQNPDSFKSRSLIESVIQKYVSPKSIPFEIDHRSEQIAIGEYLFDKPSFHELIRCVWMGGLPRWRDHIRPDYVLTMKETISEPKNPIFKGCYLAPCLILSNWSIILGGIALIDRHAHLDVMDDLSNGLSQARSSGVKATIAVGIKIGSIRKTLKNVRPNRGFVYSAIGYHP